MGPQEEINLFPLAIYIGCELYNPLVCFRLMIHLPIDFNILIKETNTMAIHRTINGQGKYHDYTSKEDVINYILNPDKTPSGFVGFINVDQNNPALSMHQCAAQHGKDKGIQLRHIVVSFYEHEIPDHDTANSIAKELMFYIGQQYQALYAVHENTDYIHFHLAFNNISLTGKRYYGTKKEYYAITNTLRIILKKYGINYLKLE